MNFKAIEWPEAGTPQCDNGTIVVLVQYGEAEIARFITPKPKGAPDGGGDFILEVCDNEDSLEEDVFNALLDSYPQLKKPSDNPQLYHCPELFSARAVWE